MSNTNDSKNPNARARGNKNATVTAGQNLAEQMSSGDWDRRFEQLFDLFLIDVDSEFYDEKLPFDEPKDLEEKFETLETQNLFYISRLQDMEEQLEDIKELAGSRRIFCDAQYNKQLKAREDIEKDIEDKNMQLAALRKANKGSRASHEKTDANEFDIDNALEELNSVIRRIYIRVQNKSADEDLSGKTALDMLTDIETRAMLDIEQLTSHAKVEPKDLNTFENDQRILYLQDKADRKKAQMQRMLEEKQAMATKASNKELVPMRRRVVARAVKPQLKKKTPPKVTDSD